MRTQTRVGLIQFGPTLVALFLAEALTGPWIIVPHAASPFIVGAPGPAEFFRLRRTE